MASCLPFSTQSEDVCQVVIFANQSQHKVQFQARNLFPSDRSTLPTTINVFVIFAIFAAIDISEKESETLNCLGEKLIYGDV